MKRWCNIYFNDIWMCNNILYFYNSICESIELYSNTNSHYIHVYFYKLFRKYYDNNESRRLNSPIWAKMCIKRDRFLGKFKEGPPHIGEYNKK